MMGSFGESSKDLEAAMVLDPTNKQALSLLSEVKKLINSAEVKKLEAGMKKVKIEEIDESSSEDEAPVQIKKSPRSRQDATPVKSRKASCSKNSPKTQPASAENSPKPIKSPFEFNHRWSMVKPKSDVTMYKQVLDCCEADKLVTLLSNKVDDHKIMTFCKVALLYCKDGESERAVQILTKLSEGARFVVFNLKSCKHIYKNSLYWFLKFEEAKLI